MSHERPGRFQGNEHAFHQTENYPGVRGFIARTEGGHLVAYDGFGNKTWFIDTTSATVSLTLADAKDEFMKEHTIIKTAGINPILVYSTSGNVDGTATYSASTSFVKFKSNGTDFFRCG